MRSPGNSAKTDYNAWEVALLDEPDDESVTESPAADVSPLVLHAGMEADGVRLDKWLAERLEQFSRSRLQQWITAGSVTVNGKAAAIRQAIWEGDRIDVNPQASAESSAFQPEAMELAIVFEDDTLIVINKPAGLVVHPAAGNWSGTLLNGLLHHAPQLASVPRAGIVHRLDKETSGLMVVAKTLEAQTHLVRQLQARTVKREYLALVHGMPPDQGTVDAPIGRHPRERTRMAAFRGDVQGSKHAVTHFNVLQRVDAVRGGRGAAALLRCRLETGRTHQIRVHLQHLGFPLLGDPVYGKSTQDGIARQALHAWRLGLIHPHDETGRQWGAEVPDDFQAVLTEWGFAQPGLDDD